jgi:hypothetical protein
MDDEALAADLRMLELELHRGATRADRTRMELLLHPDFVEFGRSGVLRTREATLAEFAGGGESAPRILADRFVLQRLGDDLALLTYRSAHAGADGRRERFTWRSSLWQRGAPGWQLRFHQGTPTEDGTP